MVDLIDPVEQFWDQVLSRDPDQIRRACASLAPGELARLLSHLREMTIGEGWHPEQRASAQSTLDALTRPGRNNPTQ